MHQLRGITWDHARGYAGLEAASARFEAESGVSISWDRRSLQAFADASIEKMAQAYDLIVLDHPHVGLIAERDSLVPLPMPENAGETSIGGSLESYIWRGHLWAYPIDAACQMAVKRTEGRGRELPNWQAVFSAKPGDYRMVTPLLPVDAFDMFMTLIAGLGEEKLPYSDKEFVSGPNGILALHVLKALYRLGPSEAVGWNPIDALEAMATGEFDYSPCLFGYINYARPGYRAHRVEYRDLPVFEGTDRRRGILGGAGIGVSKNSKSIQEATDFAQWVSSEGVQSGIYLENEGQPAHRRTWLKKGGDPDYAGFFDGAYQTMETAWTRPRDVWFLGFVDDVCETFPAFFQKDGSEETFLSAINAMYQRHKTGDHK